MMIMIKKVLLNLFFHIILSFFNLNMILFYFNNMWLYTVHTDHKMCKKEILKHEHIVHEKILSQIVD